MRNRRLLLLFVGYALTVLQASLQGLVPFRILVPELGLLVALYVGLTAQPGVASACAIALVLGYVTDLLAGAPRGLHAIVFVLLCLAAKGAALRFLLHGSGAYMAFAFLSSLVGAGLIVLARLGLDHTSPPSVFVLALQALVTGLLAPLVFRLLRRCERRVARAAVPGLG